MTDVTQGAGKASASGVRMTVMGSVSDCLVAIEEPDEADFPQVAHISDFGRDMQVPTSDPTPKSLILYSTYVEYGV